MLGAKIRASFQDSDRTYGARRVWHDLLAAGIECGLHAIERYPEVRFGSSAVDADPRGVSTWWTPQDPYAPESPDNPTLYIVAVADADGGCAVGMATGVGTFDDGVIADDAPSRCTAEAAREPLGIPLD